MVFNIDSSNQLVFGPDYFFHNGAEGSGQKQLIKAFTKDIIISLTIQENNEYWVYNFISKQLMFQPGDRGDTKMVVSFREDFQTDVYSIPMTNISDDSLKLLKGFLESWMKDQTVL